MPAQADSNPWLRSSRYFIEGEDVGRAGGTLLDCRYIRGATAFVEWMAGFQEGRASRFELTDDMVICSPHAPNSELSVSEENTGTAGFAEMIVARQRENTMAEVLRPNAFEITAFEGRILLEAPGLAATLDIEAASLLSDQLLAACGSARLQQHVVVGQAPNSSFNKSR